MAEFAAVNRRALTGRRRTLVTPEGSALPPNTLDEIRRDLARLAVVREQIEAIERDRLARLQQAPQSRSNAMVVLLARVVGVGLETADMLVQEVLSRVRLLAGDPRDEQLLSRLQTWTQKPGCAELAGCAARVAGWADLLSAGRDVFQA